MYIDQSRTHRHLVASAYARLNNNGKQRKIVKKKKKKIKIWTVSRQKDQRDTATQCRILSLFTWIFFILIALSAIRCLFYILSRHISFPPARATFKRIKRLSSFLPSLFSSSRYFENFFSLIIYFILDTRSFPVQEYNNK